jgi:hypothetical protein
MRESQQIMLWICRKKRDKSQKIALTCVQQHNTMKGK